MIDQSYLPLFVITLTPVEGTGGTDSLNFVPPVGELWIIHHAFASHDDVAAKNVQWGWVDTRTGVTGILCAVIATNPLVARYFFTDTGITPTRPADNFSYPKAAIAGLAAGKFLSGWALVTRIRGVKP